MHFLGAGRGLLGDFSGSSGERGVRLLRVRRWHPHSPLPADETQLAAASLHPSAAPPLARAGRAGCSSSARKTTNKEMVGEKPHKELGPIQGYLEV